MRTMTAEKAATEIRRAYGPGRRGEWMTVTALTHRLDLTIDEITAGVLHLLAHDDAFEVMPESNQKILTAEDRGNRIWFAGDWNDLISWR